MVETPRATVHFHSLGCPKNQLDSEVMLGTLATAGYAIAECLEDADVVVVNTCAFIESAREESIEAILEVSDLRREGRLRALVVTGCLPQRYGDELARELPEVDLFLGTGTFPSIASALDEALSGRSRGVYVEAGRTHLYDENDPRLRIGPRHSAYVKIAEGCNRPCAFCAIPGIRGRFQSRQRESVLAEVRALVEGGAREINLVAQDSTVWGRELPGRPTLADLLRDLDGVDGLDWIRLLYVYPSAVTDDLIAALAGARRVLPYVDVPLQHASDGVLRAMKRGTDEAAQRRLVERLRSAIPDLTLRTTFLVGFPGETETDFERLCSFAEDLRFDRVGVFRYSDEEGTAAFDYPNKVPRELARERHQALVGLLSRIMREQLEALIGTQASALVESSSGSLLLGRLSTQAPEVDGMVFLKGQAEPGEIRPVQITGVRGADLEAELL